MCGDETSGAKLFKNSSEKEIYFETKGGGCCRGACPGAGGVLQWIMTINREIRTPGEHLKCNYSTWVILIFSMIFIILMVYYLILWRWDVGHCQLGVPMYFSVVDLSL